MAEKKEYIVQITDFTDYGKALFVGGMFPDTELIRCRDCKYMQEATLKKGFLICPASGMEITDDDFCSYAERKEE